MVRVLDPTVRAPGQFGQAPAPKQKTGPGLIGPLTLRDLFLLFAGLLAFIALFVPNRSDFYFGYSHTLWHWHITTIGPLVFEVLAILLIVAAVLVNKLGSKNPLKSVVTAIVFGSAYRATTEHHVEKETDVEFMPERARRISRKWRA